MKRVYILLIVALLVVPQMVSAEKAIRSNASVSGEVPGQDVQGEDDAYNLDEKAQYLPHFARSRHIEEYAVDVNRQQRDDNLLDEVADNILELRSATT